MAMLAVASTEEKPDQPEILGMVRESRNFEVPFWDAPLLQWPWYLKLETSECYRAEYDYQERITFNLNQQAQQLENKLKNGS